MSSDYVMDESPMELFEHGRAYRKGVEDKSSENREAVRRELLEAAEETEACVELLTRGKYQPPFVQRLRAAIQKVRECE